MIFNVKIAGLVFEVHTLYKYSAKCCKEYIVDEPADIIIEIDQEDIDAERELCKKLDEHVDEFLQDSPAYYLESVVLLRKIANEMIYRNRILMHGSAIAINGKGYIFTALSGTGKSTHTALLRKLHGVNAVMVNDDKPFLHLAEDGIFVCGTPWMGKHKLGNNISVPLCGIFFLRRSELNELQEISSGDALMPLVSQCYRPVEAAELMQTFDLIEKILGSVKLYDFGCNMDISAAELSSSVM